MLSLILMAFICSGMFAGAGAGYDDFDDEDANVFDKEPDVDHEDGGEKQDYDYCLTSVAIVFLVLYAFCIIYVAAITYPLTGHL